MKKTFLQSMGSGLTLGAVVGVGIFLFNTPAEQGWKERILTLIAAAFAALVGGFLLGLVFYLLELLRARKFNAFREELKTRGELRAEEAVSLIRDGKKISGRLFLTDSFLVFRSSGVTEDSFEVSLDSITAVQVSDPRLCRITVTYGEESKVLGVVDPRFWFDALGKEKKVDESSSEGK